MIRYEYVAGMPFIPSLNGGLCVPQVYCKSKDGKISFTDDVIFKSKKGLFKILVYLTETGKADMAAVDNDLSDIETISQRHISRDDITCIVESDVQDSIYDFSPYSLYAVASAEEFAQSNLCHGRPEPRYYDPQRLRKELKGHRYTIIRSDRFVFASCSTRDELRTALEALASYLDGSSSGMPR
jgi:hypothetical protein